MSPAKSVAWKYFLKTDTGGKCKLCGSLVKSTGTTTNLFLHLKRRHPKLKVQSENAVKESFSETETRCEESEEASEDCLHPRDSSFVSTTSLTSCNIDAVDDPGSEIVTDNMASTSGYCAHKNNSDAVVNISSARSMSRQPLITETVNKIKSYYDGGNQARKLTNAIIFMICKDSLPLSTTEKEGFLFVMKTAAPLYKVPSRKTITKLVDDRYNVLFNIIKSKIIQIPTVTITTDIWTDTFNTKSYLGITCHFLCEGKTRNLTLDIVQLEQSHTSDYITGCLQATCDKWEIPLDKITAIVTDNGKNMVKSVADLVGKNKHLPCFAHTMDLVAVKVTYDNDCIKSLIDKVKNIVTFFKQSVRAADELRKAQPENNILKLKQCVPTRWNSVYYMFERFIYLYKYLAPIILSNPKAPPIIDATELEEMKEVITILKPIELVSKELSGESYITSSKVIQIVNCLKRKLESTSHATELSQHLKQLTLTELTKRFGAIEQNKLLAVATILDPRFKGIHFHNPECLSQGLNFINRSIKHEDWINMHEPVPKKLKADQNENCSQNYLWSFHDELAKLHKEKVNETGHSGELSLELKLYLQGPALQLEKCPFSYWENNASKISEISLKYLSVVGSSVPCERLFSKAGHILNEYRSSLNSERFGKLLFLNTVDKEDWHLE